MPESVLKLWAHLVSVVALMATISALAVFLIGGITAKTLGPLDTLAATLAVILAIAGDATGGVLLKRFYDHHPEHAQWIGGILDRVRLQFPDPTQRGWEARRTMALTPEPSAGNGFLTKPAEVDDRDMALALDHFRWSLEYRRAGKVLKAARSSIGEYENVHNEKRELVKDACAEATKLAFPGAPLSPPGYPYEGGYINADLIGEYVWLILITEPERAVQKRIGNFTAGRLQSGSILYDEVVGEGFNGRPLARFIDGKSRAPPR